MEGEGAAVRIDRVDAAAIVAARVARPLVIDFVEEVFDADPQGDVLVDRRVPLRIGVDYRICGLVVEAATTAKQLQRSIAPCGYYALKAGSVSSGISGTKAV